MHWMQFKLIRLCAMAGLLMGLQERLIVCGWPLAIYGMVLFFIFGPRAFAAALYLVGLTGWPHRCQPPCCNRASKGKVGDLVTFSPIDGCATT
jgi:hypothetical protein